MTPDPPRSRWGSDTGHATGSAYQARFDAIAASGADMHGEAHFVAARVPAPARVLDGGCGTGRVAIRLAELGYDVVGVDADPSMLGAARTRAPSLPWVLDDLSRFELRSHRLPDPFDAVVLAGNVVPLLAPGTLDATMDALADHLALGAELVAGFGLDSPHLPGACPVTPLAAYDDACRRAGLTLLERYGTWDGQPFTHDGYAVSVHRLTGSRAASPPR